MLQDWFSSLDPETKRRVVFFTLFGSQNQNYRSMVVDGEVCFVVSRYPSVVSYLDLVALIGESRWIDGPEELDALLPPPSEWRRRLQRWIKLIV